MSDGIGVPLRSHESAGFATRVVRKVSSVFKRSQQKARGWFAKVVFALPVFSRRNLRHRVVRCEDNCTHVESFPDSAWIGNKDWYLTIRRAEMIQRKTACCDDKKALDLFRQSATRYNQGEDFRLPEVFLAGINNARIYSRDFLLMSADRKRLYHESSLWRDDILDANGIFDVVFWPSPKMVSGEYCLLSCPCADKNYSEWLLGNLPRLSLIEKFPELKSVRLIVPRSLKQYQRESLEMAGVSPERLVEFDDGYWQVDKLYFTELPSPLGNPSPYAVEWLRSKFLGNASTPATGVKRLLYVTRRDAPQRRVLNEKEIVDYLKGIGFEVICPGDYSFAEQIKMFSEASVVVGPHGAAFANMVFAPAGATLIEFFGDNYLHGCYWALASICGQKHTFVTGPSRWLDYTISLEALKATLAKVLPAGVVRGN